MTDLPPAGWYADPEDPSQQRYWDGTTWTEHRVPGPPPAAQQPTQPPTQPSDPWSTEPTAPWGTQAGDPSYAPNQGLSFPQRGPETSGAAIAALVMGILSIVACLGPITGIPAMVVGRRATRDIDASNGQLEGRGLASAGVITGLIGSLLWGLIVLLLIVGLVAASNG
jgi:hypothetical protein